jgi:hypothetical protein
MDIKLTLAQNSYKNTVLHKRNSLVYGLYKILHRFGAGIKRVKYRPANHQPWP